MNRESRKQAGAYYTPSEVVSALVRWAVRSPGDRMLDPTCGDGRFLALHRQSVGVEQDGEAAKAASETAPWAAVHDVDFFAWAAETKERFDCAAGNPPFIRYQRFNGDARKRARLLCKRLGADFSGLSSSWAPCLVAAASLVREGGRFAFVVPAEVGHAPYAAPLLRYLAEHFARVQVVAVREKLFPDLSEDCWLLYAEGRGGRAREFELTAMERFEFRERPPRTTRRVSIREWEGAKDRLRPFLAGDDVLSLYRRLVQGPGARKLGEVARVGIGYVTGANDYFHLRPSTAEESGIPSDFLLPTVRNSRMLPEGAVTGSIVERWLREDRAVLLLRIRKGARLPAPVRRYLETPEAKEARTRYKCRNRDPWYVLRDVRVPDLFLSYMSGNGPQMVANRAGCACSNSIHAVSLDAGVSARSVQTSWRHPFTQLSCELQGHPLGGGMLKLEPREASAVTLAPEREWSREEIELIEAGLSTMKRWRHYGPSARDVPLDRSA
jgi:adenine-specific DNA methylase